MLAREGSGGHLVAFLFAVSCVHDLLLSSKFCFVFSDFETPR